MPRPNNIFSYKWYKSGKSGSGSHSPLVADLNSWTHNCVPTNPLPSSITSSQECPVQSKPPNSPLPLFLFIPDWQRTSTICQSLTITNLDSLSITDNSEPRKFVNHWQFWTSKVCQSLTIPNLESLSITDNSEPRKFVNHWQFRTSKVCQSLTIPNLESLSITDNYEPQLTLRTALLSALFHCQRRH